MTIQQKIARQQEIVNGARSAGRDLTADEQREFDTLQGEIEAARSANPTGGGEGGQPTGGARGEEDPAGGEGSQPTGGSRGAGNPAGGVDPQQAVVAERQRMADIVALCRETGMEPDQYLRNGDTLDTVRAAAVTHLIQHGAPVHSRMSGDQGDNFRQAAAEALADPCRCPRGEPQRNCGGFPGHEPAGSDH